MLYPLFFLLFSPLSWPNFWWGPPRKRGMKRGAVAKIQYNGNNPRRATCHTPRTSCPAPRATCHAPPAALHNSRLVRNVSRCRLGARLSCRRSAVRFPLRAKIGGGAARPLNRRIAVQFPPGAKSIRSTSDGFKLLAAHLTRKCIFGECFAPLPAATSSGRLQFRRQRIW